MPETLAAGGVTETDARILTLFDAPGAVETPTPGARVWLARDPHTKNPVLLRRVPPAAATAKARATEALRLTHLNIVPTRRWLLEANTLYVVRDVVRGRNLKQTLAALQYRQTPELLEKLLLPLFSALEHAHGRGLAHGGISPENVLIADDGLVLVSDFGATDPQAPQHTPAYGGHATVAGDVRALGRLFIRYLPTGGAFGNEVVRQRIAGIVERCDSLSDLRETLSALEKLANAPVPRPTEPAPAPPPIPWVGPPPLPMETEESAAPAETATTREVTVDESPTNPAEWVQRIGNPVPADPPARAPIARLSCQVAEKALRITQGGGGTATLLVRNEGEGTLVIRMVATQHSWLNVRPMELPLTLPGGATAVIEFTVSAARLSPGEYRSEVYLSANSGGRNAEDLRSGWFKHTAEVRITVEKASGSGNASSPVGGAPPVKGAPPKPPYPANAPVIPAPAGCGTAFTAALLFVGGTAAMGLYFLLT